MDMRKALKGIFCVMRTGTVEGPAQGTRLVKLRALLFQMLARQGGI